MFITPNNYSDYRASDSHGTTLSALATPPCTLVLTSKADGQEAVGKLVDAKLWLYRFKARDGSCYDLVIRKDKSVWYKSSSQPDKTAKVSHSITKIFELLNNCSAIHERAPRFVEPSKSGVSLDVPQHSSIREQILPQWLEPVIDCTKPYGKERYEDLNSI